MPPVLCGSGLIIIRSLNTLSHKQQKIIKYSTQCYKSYLHVTNLSGLTSDWLHRRKLCTQKTINNTSNILSIKIRYVQDWTLMRIKFSMISITKCSHSFGKTSPKYTQFCQIWSNMKMSNYPVKYGVLIKQYWLAFNPGHNCSAHVQTMVRSPLFSLTKP